MINHFKAEFYKLRHSKILITILGVCAAVIMVSFALGDMTFFGAGDGTESVIGFQAKCYLSSEIPTFQTVARSSLAYTAFFWIIGILFATIFFTKEYNTGTIKLSVAYGTIGENKLRELMDSGELEYIQNGNRRLIADAAIWDWYHRAKTTAKPPARQGG